MKSGLFSSRSAPRGAARSDRAESGIPGTASGMARPKATAPQDSELAHSFGPGGIGFDFLPLEIASGNMPLPTQPAAPIPSLDLEGNDPLPEIADPSAPRPSARPQHRDRSAGEIWLEGSSILCACPDCRAPMTIRIWLMVADCWRCGTSIELSQEQEREVQRLLADQESAQRVGEGESGRGGDRVVPPPAAPPRFRGSPPDVGPRVAETDRRRENAPTPPRPLAPSPPPAAPRTARQEPRPPTPRPQHSVAARAAAARQLIRREPLFRHLLNDTPAWLISLLVHLILLTLLALITREEEIEDGPFITLSSMTSRMHNEGGDTIRMTPDDRAQFDLPLPNKVDLSDPQEREVMLAAAQDARELRIEDDSPHLPDLAALKAQIGRADGIERGFLSRDPRLRAEVVTQEGGTTLTEAAVARGLRWLANHQNSDGSWSLAGFRHAGDCDCKGDGHYHGKSPGTALAMLPFLGAGQTHLAGKYRGTVSRGLKWLIENQAADGDLRAGSDGNEGMYTHGQAAIVLCEAFAMTGDEALRLPAQQAIDFIVAAQYRDGGWRYRPAPRSQIGDTSVVGWQLMALQSARAANLNVPDETWGMADLYLDSVQHNDGARYSYQARGGPTHVMTAEALLCRMYLGWGHDKPGLTAGISWLADEHLPNERRPNYYYWYYGTQVLHHHGGQEWDAWNLQMRDILCKRQKTRGHLAGSWDPAGDHAEAGGRIYVTSLAICTLEVYYRHLPIFRQIELAR